MHSFDIASAFQKAGQAFAKNAVPLILITVIGAVIAFIPQAMMTRSLVGDLGLSGDPLERLEQRNSELGQSVTDFGELMTSDPSQITEEDVQDSIGGILDAVGADSDKVFELAERAEGGEEIGGAEALGALLGNPFGNTATGSSSFGFGKIAFFGLISFVIGLFVQSAIVQSSLDAVMGRKITKDSVLGSFKKIPMLILFGIIMMVIGLINIIPLLGAILFLIITLMVIQAPYLIFEENKGAIDAMSKSKDLMAGNKLKMFLTFILLGILNMIGALLAGVGLLITMPYSATVMAQIFKDLSQGAKA